MKQIYSLLCLIACWGLMEGTMAAPGDTTVVRTFRFDSSMRSGVFMFPNDPGKTYEKILMLYSMRCKNGLVSTSANTNLGCGEWDYNCYTYVVDSSQTDSLRQTHSNYDISQFSGGSFAFTYDSVYTYTLFEQQSVTYGNVIGENTGSVGNDVFPSDHPLGSADAIARTQYLWTAAELTAAELTTGDITALRMELQSTGNMLNNLRIRIKTTQQTYLDPYAPELDGFTEVYFLNTSFLTTGLQQFNFYNPFTWDGSSNLLVEFSYQNISPGVDNIVKSHDPGFDFCIHSLLPDGYLEWSGGVQNMTVNPSVYPSLTDKITIAFWAFGDSAMLPANTTILEGVNAANQRQVNIHFPWSDSRIYWDCGGDASGYDRIDQAASVDEIRGKWNFWAFTKNAGTGVMSIFKNGHLWTSGSGKTRPIDIRKWLLGCDANGSGLHYYGKMDELSIWNKDLDSNAIQQIMMNDISSSHPDYDSLLAYYSFNDGSGFTAADSGPHSYPSQLVNPGWRSFRGYELHRNFVLGDLRPNTTFIQGVYDTTYIQQFPIYDSTLNLATSVISYAVSNNNLSVQDTIYVWPAGYTYVFDPLGNVLDSVFIAGQDTLSVFPLTYYQRRPMRVELINFITPYGINLNLNGLTGRTWTYDVTDYARVLKGPRFMAMSDGAYQEDNDITFIYYEGTPPRTVHSLSQIWPSGSWVVPSYNDIVNNVYFEPRQVTLSPAAAQFKIRSAISGHGQEGEFIPRIHTISVNDSIKYLRQVWKACATNPIYPQGGTWVYDRAGWCPGAVVDNKDFELTSKVTPGHTITIDYSLPYIMNPGSSNYRVNNQLVSYGPANFTLDAAVEYIKSPSDRTEYMRLNPLCNQPLVAIKNTGSTPLTSVDITYGRVGAPLSTFHWTGNLNFLQLAELSLPAPDWDGSSSDRFIMYVSQPNGGNDQYALNDTLYSKFVVPPVYPTHLFFELKTNLYAYEDSYILKNADGDTIIYRHNLTSNTMYRDTVELPYGCYTLLMTDNGDDGLSFWANPDQGSGYFRIFDSKNPMILKTFNPDFGNNIYLQFRTNTAANVPDIQPVAINNLEVYPNPSSGSFDVELSMPLNSLVTLEVLNVTGQVVIKETVRVSQVPEKVTINGDQFENGVYFVQAGSGNKQVTRKMVIGK